jgi:hypothetical protein
MVPTSAGHARETWGLGKDEAVGISRDVLDHRGDGDLLRRRNLSGSCFGANNTIKRSECVNSHALIRLFEIMHPVGVPLLSSSLGSNTPTLLDAPLLWGITALNLT